MPSLLPALQWVAQSPCHPRIPLRAAVNNTDSQLSGRTSRYPARSTALNHYVHSNEPVLLPRVSVRLSFTTLAPAQHRITGRSAAGKDLSPWTEEAL